MTEKHPLKVLADYRAAAKKTQADLAQDLGVAVMTVSRWETGDRKIGIKTLSLVSEKTGLPKRELRPDLADTMQEAV
jgi:transcriptional regulator with XRE-family HTH domain